MYDQSTVISLLRTISTQLDTLSGKIDSLSALQTSIDRMITLAAVGILIFTFSFILKGWCKK